MSFTVRAGPRHETEENNGISHLVEHLLFRGTTKHPSSFSFNSAVESLGGEINGLTQRDGTTIHMTVPKAHVDTGLSLLGELCTNPVLTGIEIERDVVVEEILDTCDSDGHELDPDTIARSTLWSEHPIGLPVAGTVDNVLALTEAECRAFYEQVFVANNGVLCIAGPIDIQGTFRAAEAAFGSMPRGEQLALHQPPCPPRTPAIQIRESEDSQVAILLSFPAPHENHPDFSALMMLRRLLDDGLASRLRQDVCESRGLAYSVSAAVDVYADIAAVDLEATCSPAKVVRTLQQMLKTLSTLVEAGVGDEELRRVKLRHRAELEFALDDPVDLCGWFSSAALVGSELGYVDRLEEAAALTAQDLVRVAREVFDRESALLTLVGPVDDESLRDLERLMGHPEGSAHLLDEHEEADADDTNEERLAEEEPALRVIHNDWVDSIAH